MKAGLLRMSTPTTLLARLIEAPDLVRTIRALPTHRFSALFQQVGVEDAGEIIALATTEQIVAAFDEDLFVNESPGEREVFDVGRFVIWLEVILEAGDDVAARRIAELSEAFVVHALSSVVLVLDHDALRYRICAGGSSAFSADKTIESSLSEEMDGYLLVSRVDEGWDATLALILALDRDHRPLLVRLLDQCSAIASEYVEDLEALTTVLTAEESLSEDVEAERETRRSKLGYVEPRAARSFLALAREPLTADISSTQRDPITHAYFRDMERRCPPADNAAPPERAHPGMLLEIVRGVDSPLPGLPASHAVNGSDDPVLPFIKGMQLLNDEAHQRFSERMEELAYLANVMAAGAVDDGRRMRPSEAAEAVLATVALGAELEARARRLGEQPQTDRATATELLDVLRVCPADLLFRKASSLLASRSSQVSSVGFLHSRTELIGAIGHH